MSPVWNVAGARELQNLIVINVRDCLTPGRLASPCIDDQLVDVSREFTVGEPAADRDLPETSVREQSPNVGWIEVRQIESVQRGLDECPICRVLLVAMLRVHDLPDGSYRLASERMT